MSRATVDPFRTIAGGAAALLVAITPAVATSQAADPANGGPPTAVAQAGPTAAADPAVSPESPPIAVTPPPPLAPIAPLATAPAEAPPTTAPPLAWKPAWKHARPLEYAATVTFGIGALVSQRIPVKDRHWSVNGLDDGIRDGLRIHSQSGRQTARDISDGLFYGLMAYPIVVDTLLVAGPRNSEVAWQMFVISGQSMALSGAASVLIERTTGRARPFVRECAKNPDSEEDCSSSNDEKYQSFISGHTLMGFTGAGLMCAHHTHLPLYGNRFADLAACAVGTASATAEGVLRIAADRHYATDVTLGAVLGFGSGYGMPMLLHYARGGDESSKIPATVSPYATSSEAGLMAVGTF